MSGFIGWHGNNRQSSSPSTPTPSVTPGYFGRGASKDQDPVIVTVKSDPTSVPQSSRPASKSTRSRAASAARPSIASVAASARLPIPDAMHSLVSTAEIVVIGVLDMTGSMSTWPEEILKRLPRLHGDACEYFGTQSVEILFIAHGDSRTDSHAIQVARFGSGPELEPMLASFTSCGGGGQGSESQEIVATYLLQQVNTASARQVYTFFITDEAACPEVDEQLVKRDLGIGVNANLRKTQAVFDLLKRRMNIYTVLCDTQYYSAGIRDEIRSFWQTTVGVEHVLPLNDARRVTDVMIGVFAKTTGQMGRFTGDLQARQGGTVHGKQNIATVMHSISMVGGSVHAPQVTGPGTRPLLPAGDPSHPSK